MSEPRFGPFGLDAALEVTKRLQEVMRAEVVDVETDEHTTTVFLSVPASAVARASLMRRREWVSHVNENVRRRKAYASGVLSRIGLQREHLIDAVRVSEGAGEAQPRSVGELGGDAPLAV